MHKKFVDTSLSEEFLTLSKNELMEIISTDELNVGGEEQVGLKASLYCHILVTSIYIQTTLKENYMIGNCSIFLRRCGNVG